MAKVDIKKLVQALDTIDKVLKHPVSEAILKGLAPMLPKFGVTAEQQKEIAALRGDIAARRERVRKRAQR